LLLRELDDCLAFAADEDPRGQARRVVGETAELFIADAALVGHIATAAGGALRQWASGQISDAAFRTRVRLAVDVVFAAGASEEHAAALTAPLMSERRRA
jgi:hypothetical protein